ncbi:MAG TPA: hypothetical protein VMQ81_00120 [Acidimicrobiia bacterium]|nr:hypothetical protein [Acidimicrobiia bacterium]
MACYGAKGGVGASAVAAALALIAAREHGRALLVDLAGDQADLFGVTPHRPGLDGWLESADDLALDALSYLETPAGGDVGLLARHRTAAPPRPERVAALLACCSADSRPGVVDAGLIGTISGNEAALRACEQVLLVVRPCYLTLRRALEAGLHPTGIVVVTEPGRALRAGDVAQALGAPVVAELPVDPRVARVLDAGLVASRLPSLFTRPLSGVWHG